VLKISVTQIETYMACPRKWWWERVMRRGASSTPNTFGTVIHSCMERAVQGKNIFPAGWEYAFDRYTGKETGRLTNNEQALAKMLVHRAQEDGWFAVDGKFDVEYAFDKEVVPNVRIVGFIDFVDHRGVVVDYKSTSSMRWAETEETLKDNTQLLVYAKMSGFDKGCKVQHKILCKNPPSVHKVEVTVEGDRIQQEWDKVKDIAGKMLELKSVTDKDAVECNLKECSNYGGCAFRGACFPQEDY